MLRGHTHPLPSLRGGVSAYLTPSHLVIPPSILSAGLTVRSDSVTWTYAPPPFPAGWSPTPPFPCQLTLHPLILSYPQAYSVQASQLGLTVFGGQAHSPVSGLQYPAVTSQSHSVIIKQKLIINDMRMAKLHQNLVHESLKIFWLLRLQPCVYISYDIGKLGK